MSKQLSLSAAISTIAMVAFALLADSGVTVTYEKGATGLPAAPAFEAIAPGR